jgi:2'-5' RNA ligase
MRTFIAINLDDAIKDAIREKTAPVREVDAKIKWVEKQNLHLTLRFLGEVKPETVPRIDDAMRKSCEGIAPFDMVLKGAGCFPERGRPRVVWVAVEDGADTAKRIAERLRKELSGLPVKPDDKAFKAHITIGRIKKVGDRDAFHATLENLKELFLGSQTINTIELMESQLTPGGPIYSVSSRIPLG